VAGMLVDITPPPPHRSVPVIKVAMGGASAFTSDFHVQHSAAACLSSSSWKINAPGDRTFVWNYCRHSDLNDTEQ